MINVIAIDPGYSGGLAVIEGAEVSVIKCPDSVFGIMDVCSDLADGKSPVAVIEQQHTFPSRMIPCAHCHQLVRQPQGSKSVWTLAENYTAWLCGLKAAGIPCEIVTAGQWMRSYNTGKSAKKADRKRALKRLAQGLYPRIRVTLWNADALMLLDWYRKRGVTTKEPNNED